MQAAFNRVEVQRKAAYVALGARADPLAMGVLPLLL
jgi:hypothetical protein